MCSNTYVSDGNQTDPLVTFAPVDGNPLVVKVKPTYGSGQAEVTFVADNGTEDPSDDVESENYKFFYVYGGDEPYLSFTSDTATVPRYSALTLNWGSNLDTDVEADDPNFYTINLYQGDFTGKMRRWMGRLRQPPITPARAPEVSRSRRACYRN